MSQKSNRKFIMVKGTKLKRCSMCNKGLMKKGNHNKTGICSSCYEKNKEEIKRIKDFFYRETEAEELARD